MNLLKTPSRNGFLGARLRSKRRFSEPRPKDAVGGHFSARYCAFAWPTSLWRSARYVLTHSASGGMGARPARSIFSLESAEYFGRRAGVRYSRSLVACSGGFRPALSTINFAKLNQESGVPPAM